MEVFIGLREGVFGGYRGVRKIRLAISKQWLGLAIVLVAASLGLRCRDLLALVLG